MIGFKNKSKVLLGVPASQSWKDLADLLETEKALSDTAVIVSDGEPELRDAFANKDISVPDGSYSRV